MQGRLRLDQEDIRSRLMQDLHSSAVKPVQHVIADTIMSAVFRTVREEGSVGPDSCQAQRPGAACLFTLFFPPLLPGFTEDFNRAGNQMLRLSLCISVCHQARNRRLITAGDPAVRSGSEIVQVDLPDELGRIGQSPGGPEL